MKINKYSFVKNFFNLDLTPIDYSIGWGNRDPDSHLFLWGPKSASLFRNKKNVSLVGNIVSDALYNGYFNSEKSSLLKKKLKLDCDLKTILLSAQCLKDDNNNSQVIDLYKELIDSVAKFNLIIKLHPRDDKQNFRFIKKNDNIKIIQHSYSFRSLLEISDLNLSHYSATSMDAILFGVPVILLPYKILTNETKNFWYGNDIFFIYDSTKLSSQYIDNVLKDSCEKTYRSKREKFLMDMFSENVGNSKSIVIKKINQLLKVYE